MEINDLDIKSDIILENKLEESRNDKLNKNFKESLKDFLENKRNGVIMMKDMATIDRIEGEYAVCEMLSGEMVDIHINKFKTKPNEGDIFNVEIISKNGCLEYNVGDKNIEEMENRRRLILEKLNKLK